MGELILHKDVISKLSEIVGDDPEERQVKLNELSNNLDYSGTGIFELPNPLEGSLSVMHLPVKDLTLAEARLRSINTIRATWIPNAMEEYENIIYWEYCQGSCVFTGNAGCKLGCLCNPYYGVCELNIPNWIRGSQPDAPGQAG